MRRDYEYSAHEIRRGGRSNRLDQQGGGAAQYRTAKPEPVHQGVGGVSRDRYF